MARKTALESQKTRDSILDAAERVFAEKGVAGTTMAEIADTAGISRGAVYGHYRNTGEVCIAMAERAFTTAPEAAHLQVGVDTKSDDPLGTLWRIVVGYFDLLQRPGRLRTVLEVLYYKCEHVEGNRPILEWNNRVNRAELLQMEQLLEDAIAHGQLPADLDVRRANAYINAVLFGLIDLRYFAHLYFDVASDGREVLEASLETLRYSTRLRKPAA